MPHCKFSRNQKRTGHTHRLERRFQAEHRDQPATYERASPDGCSLKRVKRPSDELRGNAGFSNAGVAQHDQLHLCGIDV
jgi:hypothetical protein